MSDDSDVPPRPPDLPEDDEEDGPAWTGVVREVAIAAVVILGIAAILFALSGVWPPLVAVESDSMEPEIMTGDLVFIVDEHRFTGDGAIEGTGIVPMDVAAETGDRSFDRYGDVIIFAPNGEAGRTPIIHRAHFWVEEDENWYDRANASLVGEADGCDELANCPAPNQGFITHGDNNAFYDQAQPDHRPVKDEWIVARAAQRIPWIGNLRLVFGDVLAGSASLLHVEP